MTIKDIILEKLRALGADGLASYECGCAIDDLGPCGAICNMLDCVPARQRKGVSEDDANPAWEYYEGVDNGEWFVPITEEPEGGE